MIIGCPGSGKSTFARELHRLTSLPLCHLDLLNRNPDRTTVEKPVFIERLKAVISTDEWIIDGNYGGSLEMRFEKCDTVFFLDYPVEVCLGGIMSRKGKPRPDMPFVNALDEENDAEFIEFIRSYNESSRPKVMSLLEKYSDRNIVIFTSRTQSDDYLENLRAEKAGRVETVRNAVDKIIHKRTPSELRSHAYSHLFGVSQFASILAQKRGENAGLAAIAGLLHDIYTYSENDSADHAHKGAAMAYDILDGLNIFTELEISAICTAIYNHSDKAHVHGKLDEILKDADVLQHMLYNPYAEILPKEADRYEKLRGELGLG